MVTLHLRSPNRKSSAIVLNGFNLKFNQDLNLHSRLLLPIGLCCGLQFVVVVVVFSLSLIGTFVSPPR